MPKFTVQFRRVVEAVDTFTREIEAENEGEAYSLADQMASDADDNCPDDATSDGSESCGSWAVAAVRAV